MVGLCTRPLTVTPMTAPDPLRAGGRLPVRGARNSVGTSQRGSPAVSKQHRVGDRVDDGFGHDPADAWLAAAEQADLGDVTWSAKTPWATTVSVRSEADARVVRVGGELATGSAAYLDLVLEQELSAAPRALIVDLSGAAFMGVRGIAALVRAAGRAAANSTTVCVSAPIHLDLLRHLRAMGIAELFEVHTSVAGCRWALARPEPTRSPWTQSPPDPFDVGEF